MPQKWAYLVHPHTGGTWTVFEYLRKGLCHYDINLRWVSTNPTVSKAISSSQWSHELNRGEAPATGATTDHERSLCLIRHLETHGYEGIFLNCRVSISDMLAGPYLAQHIRRIMIVHNITLGTYRPAAFLQPWIHHCICPARRQYNDLKRSYGFSADRLSIIPHAISHEQFPYIPRSKKQPDQPLKILSVGRIDDDSKNCMLLPKIFQHLSVDKFHLTVAGDGPALDKLKQKFSKTNHNPIFLGNVPYTQVPELFRQADVFLMPSRYEGFGYTIIEAMATGCVPVTSKLSGITDFILEEEKTGLLFPPDNAKIAAACLLRLQQDPNLLCQLSQNAYQASVDRFSLDGMAAGYKEVIMQSETATLPRQPLPIEQWSVPSAMRGGLRTKIPINIKNALRKRWYR